MNISEHSLSVVCENWIVYPIFSSYNNLDSVRCNDEDRSKSGLFHSF